jgi:ABC-type Co2+ transport system permease subunit
MFAAMLLSLRAGLEALVKGNNTYRLALLSTILLTIGGLVFGPLVQKFAFGQFWTGWPIGNDLTDNKTIAAIIFWLIATLQLKKDSSNRLWPILASIFTFFIFFIPHSLWGSQFDYRTGQIKTGK